MSSSESNWWDSISVFEDEYEAEDYTPDASVRANHRLLGGLRDNDFDTDSESYALGLLTLLLVFLVAGLLACILVPTGYCCFSKSRQGRLDERLENRNRSQKQDGQVVEREVRGGLLMLVVSFMAILSAVGTIYGLSMSGEGFSNLESNTQELADDFRAILALPNRTSAVLNNMTESYNELLETADECGSSIVTELLSGTMGSFEDDIDAVQTELENAITSDIDDIADDVESVSDTAARTEAMRRGVVWPAIGLSVLAIVSFVVIGLATYGVIVRGTAPCGPLTWLVLPGTLILAAIIWVFAAIAVTMSAVTGDFCIDAEENVQDIIRNSVDGSLTQELVVYYTTDCTSDNSVVEAISGAQETLLGMVELMSTLEDSVELVSAFCPGLTGAVDAIDANLEEAWIIMEDAAELTSCSNINGLYRKAVYDDLCDVLPTGLLGFWVSNVFLTVLLIVLVVQWARMLQRHTTDGDFADAQRSQTLWTSTRSIMKAASNYSKQPRGDKQHEMDGSQQELGSAPVALAATASRERNNSYNSAGSSRYRSAGRYALRPTGTSGRRSSSGEGTVGDALDGGTWVTSSEPQESLRRSGTDISPEVGEAEVPRSHPVELSNPQRP